MTGQLSDKGLSIFAFAAYHQLISGELVSEVVLNDGAGHHADPQGVREVEALGLAKVERDRAVLTDAGSRFLATVVKTLQGTVKDVPQATAIA